MVTVKISKFCASFLKFVLIQEIFCTRLIFMSMYHDIKINITGVVLK